MEEVAEPRDARGGLQREELVAREARGDEERARALEEHVVDVAVHLVRPAHVLREHAGREDVVRDHGLGAHVPEVGVPVVDAVLAQHAHVVHVEEVDVLGPHLVQDDDQHAGRPVARGLRGRGHRKADCENEERQAKPSEPASHDSSLGPPGAAPTLPAARRRAKLRGGQL